MSACVGAFAMTHLFISYAHDDRAYAMFVYRSPELSYDYHDVSQKKQQAGQDILVYGSARLVQTLMQHNLVDEYCLLVFPVVLGSGKRLFQDGSMATLKLADTKRFSSGVVALSYQPDRKA